MLYKWCCCSRCRVSSVAWILLCCRRQTIHQAEQYTVAEQQPVCHSLQRCHLLWTLTQWKPDVYILTAHIIWYVSTRKVIFRKKWAFCSCYLLTVAVYSYSSMLLCILANIWLHLSCMSYLAFVIPWTLVKCSTICSLIKPFLCYKYLQNITTGLKIYCSVTVMKLHYQVMIFMH